MTIQTDLSVSPYFDDFNELKDFYRVLFKPGVAVQTRELNQLQSILQNQIEKMGNNLFKQGTIIDGCDFTFHDNLQYVKIRDVETNSTAVDVGTYQGYRVKNQNNITPLEASIVTTTPGFESTDPDLNTLFLRYLNTGYKTGGPSDGQSTFDASEQLTVYDPQAPLEKITIIDGSSGFVSTDRVVILSAIAIQNTTGGTSFSNNFFVGDFITNGTANVEIVSIDTNTFTDSIVLKIKPRIEDLKSGDVSKWTLTVNNNIQSQNTSPSDIARVVSIIGSGASASISTAQLGQISNIALTNKGSGYIITPTVAIASNGATLGQIQQFDALPQNHLATITVASSQYSPVGKAYGMTVGAGVVYQKGFFSRVDEQLIIVEKYNNLPDNKSVGFETIESIINSNQDTSLLDNATGAPNFTAPGADRLKLVPRLTVISKAEADSRNDWLYLAEFSGGVPYKQNKQTVYNIIGKEINRRFQETAGNYVQNPFFLNTKHTSNFVDEPNEFLVTVDPGVAFINGSRVETTFNYQTPVSKGLDTLQITNGNISLNYGNFVFVNQLGGHFNFKTGALVDLYDTAKQYISTSLTLTPAPTGTKIGTARIRSIVYDSGVPGSTNCTYRLYLFDIQMNTGKNFQNTRSIFYDGATKAICDTVLENNNTVLKDTINTSLIYYAGVPAVNNASAISYIYKTSNNHTLGSDGTLTVSLPGGGSETFPYSGTLSSTQKRDIIVVPLANAEVSTFKTGTATTLTTSKEVVGSGTSFTTEYVSGDYIKFSGGSYGQIEFVSNNTSMLLTANASSAVSGEQHKLYFPAFAPLSLERSGRSITTNNDQTQLTVNIGEPLLAPTGVEIAYNVRLNSVVPVAKTVNRDRFIRLCLANNNATSTGPWPLGVSDVIRMKGVYLGSNGTFGEEVSTNVTSEFYIDHNQTEDYYDISYLYRKPGSNLQLANTDWLLVKLDYLSTTPGEEGLKGPGKSGTYPINDSIALANASSTMHTVEIPEVFGTRGDYYDLRDQFDFRPAANNTTNPTANSALAPLNPLYTTPSTRFSSGDKKFPSPDSELSTTISYYQGRVDKIIIDETNQFQVLQGSIGSTEAPLTPDNALSINIIKIPPYPSLAYQLSPQMIEYVDTGIANDKFTTRRVNNYRVTTAQTEQERTSNQPRGYTMVDIGKLEKRIAELEYYTSLTLTELQAQKRSLTGSGGIERFKFGFFVDSFEDYTLADTTNPGYSASIIDGYLSPAIEEQVFTIQDSMNDEVTTLPYVEEVFVSQTRATDGVVLDEVPVVQPVQIITSIIQEERNRSNSDSGTVFEEFFYTFSSKSGPVEFYINSRDNNIGLDVSQASSPNGPWTSVITSRSAQAITNQDINTKQLQTLNGGRKIEHPGTLERKSYPLTSPFGTFIEDQFKVLWNYNADNGVYIRIRVYKGEKHGGFLQSSRSGTFGFKLFYPTDTIINQTKINNTSGFLLDYLGTIFTEPG